MAKGISINIGLNAVDPGHYMGWNGELVACEFDARDMADIAATKGFDTRLLLTSGATHGAVRSAIEDAADSLEPSDILFLTYSGHGGQVPDKNGDEDDAKDETWVLYDREMVDDELFGLWSRFKPGVRIFVLSDSCHSGTVTKLMEFETLWAAELDASASPERASIFGFRAIPQDIQDGHYGENQQFYEGIQASNPKGKNVEIGASVMLISGCQDNQLSGDGPRNGVFTEKLRRVWADGAFVGDYREFYQQINDLMRLLPQNPAYLMVGADNPTFEKQQPFSV